MTRAAIPWTAGLADRNTIIQAIGLSGEQVRKALRGEPTEEDE